MSESLERRLKSMKLVSAVSANFSSDLKNRALQRMIQKLSDHWEEISEANQKDLAEGKNASLPAPILKRLKFDREKLKEVLSGIQGLIALADPVNQKLSSLLLDDGLLLTKIRVPIGVIGVIFESRPDALVQIAALCIKSGNCAVLKGGSEAMNTNRVLAQLIRQAIAEEDVRFQETIYLIETREDVAQLLKFSQYINLIIPRGSNAFVQYIQKNTRIPVLGHADGICHLYVDQYADRDKAVRILVDAKTQYVSVCNAVETLLIHKDAVSEILPAIGVALRSKGVEIRCCERSIGWVEGAVPAEEDDWKTEYLDYILSIKVVDSIEEAVEHINTYGSGHTDGIITEDEERKSYFKAFVDSASVMVNCSTRFADGFRYGMGAEVGISTNKFHARGPVGLEGLMIYKYTLEGDAHLVADYTGSQARSFLHKPVKLEGE